MAQFGKVIPTVRLRPRNYASLGNVFDSSQAYHVFTKAPEHMLISFGGSRAIRVGQSGYILSDSPHFLSSFFFMRSSLLYPILLL